VEHVCATGEDRERRECDGTAKVSGEKPAGVENAGGDTGVAVGRKTCHDTADSGLDRHPEVDATFAGAGQPAGDDANGARVASHRRGGSAGSEEETPGARTLDTAAR
jgi:hypothetical protein